MNFGTNPDIIDYEYSRSLHMPFGVLVDKEFASYTLSFTERADKSAVVLPPLGPIYLKAAALQAAMFNLAAIPLGRGFATTLAICRKSFMGRRKYKKLKFMADLTTMDLQFYEQCLTETIYDIKTSYSSFDEEETRLLQPTLPLHLSAEKNVLLDPFDAQNTCKQQILALTERQYEYEYNTGIEEVIDPRDLFAAYEPYNHKKDMFFGSGFFDKHDNIVYPQYLKLLHADLEQYLHGFIILKPHENYRPFLSYTCHLLGHVVEVTNVNDSWTKHHVTGLFSSSKQMINVYRVNSSHYLVAFKSALEAENAVNVNYEGLQVQKLWKGSALGALIASRYDLQSRFRY